MKHPTNQLKGATTRGEGPTNTVRLKTPVQESEIRSSLLALVTLWKANTPHLGKQAPN